MQIAALYYDGQTSQAHPVELSVKDSDLAIQFPDAADIKWAKSEVKFVETPTETTPIRLRHGFEGDERVVIKDSRHANELVRHFPLIAKREKTWSKNAKRLFIWGGAAIASLTFTVMVAIPIIAKQVTDNLPTSFENQMGKQATEQIIKAVAFLEKRNPDNTLICGRPGDQANRALNKLMTRIVPAAPNGLKPILKVVDLKMENAFALPGGNIVLFRGLLESMESPDELAGVLAHELGHLKYKHSTKIFIEQTGTSVLIGLLFGDVTGGTALAGIGQALLNSAHTRDAEREADVFALDVLNRENISALPAARFFERLHDKHGGIEKTLGLLNTHPMSQDRAAFFKNNATGTRPSMSVSDWAAIKSMCAGATEAK